jgi:hypothetical protein
MTSKQVKINQKIKDLQAKVNKLDRDKIHLLFFEYHLSLRNLYHSPLLFISTKPFAFITDTKPIDHVCHISRFDLDDTIKKFKKKDVYNAKIFEANVKRGMEENWLTDRLKNIDGKVYIATLDKVDKKKAWEFEQKYKGQPYSKNGALFAGLDLPFLRPSNGSHFCSWLVGKFLSDQGYFEGNTSELVPYDLFYNFLGRTKLFFDSKDYD